MTSTTAKTTVRMFDGAEYATYKVGSKKHKAAEARRAAFDARKAARKAWNGEAAKWARSKGVVPSGAAWKAITATADVSSLSVKDLKALNKADGLSLPAKKATTAPKAEVVAEVTEVATTTAPKGKKALRKAKSAAAKKGWITRRANAAKVAASSTPEVDEVAVKRAAKKASKKGKKAQIAATVDPAEVLFREQLSGLFTDAEIDRAWALKNA